MDNLLCELTDTEMSQIRGGDGLKVFLNPGDPGLEMISTPDNRLYFANTIKGTLDEVTGFYYDFLSPVVQAGGNEQWKQIV